VVSIATVATRWSVCQKTGPYDIQCFYWSKKMFCDIKSYNTCSNAVFRLWYCPTFVLLLVYCPVDDTLFEVGPEIRYSGVLSRCCYGNHTAGFKPILTLLIVVNGELNRVSLCQK